MAPIGDLCFAISEYRQVWRLYAPQGLTVTNCQSQPGRGHNGHLTFKRGRPQPAWRLAYNLEKADENQN